MIWRRNGDPPTIEYRYSDDGGKTWHVSEPLNDDTCEPNAANFFLDTDQAGIIHLLWTAPGSTLCYRRWQPDSGWKSIESLNLGSGIIYFQAMVDNEGLLHVYWPNGYKVNYARQLADGSWTDPQTVADGNGEDPEPAMAISADGTKYLVWRMDGDLIDYFYVAIP